MSVTSVPAFGKTDGVGGRAFCDISFEGRCGFILTAFDFNGDNFRFALYYKINLAVLIGKLARLNLELPSKLLQNIIFGELPFELIIAF